MTAATLTDGGRRSGHKDWGAIIERVHDEFPAVAAGRSQIRRSFAGNTDLMAAVLRDVLRVGQTPVKRGQRTMPEFDEGVARLKAMRGEDFTSLPFHRAFEALARGHSYSELAEMTGLPRSTMCRLMKGSTVVDADGYRRRQQPTAAEMEAVAAAFGKDPSYFTEFRAMLVSALAYNEMIANPEMSASVVHRLR